MQMELLEKASYTKTLGYVSHSVMPLDGIGWLLHDAYVANRLFLMRLGMISMVAVTCTYHRPPAEPISSCTINTYNEDRDAYPSNTK